MPNWGSFSNNLERHGRETGNGNVYGLTVIDGEWGEEDESVSAAVGHGTSPSFEPKGGSSCALPRQLPLQRGQGALECLADKPSLSIGDRVESFDGPWSRAGVELHRAAGAMDARQASHRLRLSAQREPLERAASVDALSASHCVLLDPFKDACAIDHGAIRAGYPQNLVMVAVEIAGMEQSGFPTVESSGGQFSAADPVDVDYVPLFFHWLRILADLGAYPSSFAEVIGPEDNRCPGAHWPARLHRAWRPPGHFSDPETLRAWRAAGKPGERSRKGLESLGRRRFLTLCGHGEAAL
jgi:hypothetical protein